MTETVIKRNSEPEIDEELLAEAKRGLGTPSAILRQSGEEAGVGRCGGLLLTE